MSDVSPNPHRFYALQQRGCDWLEQLHWHSTPCGNWETTMAWLDRRYVAICVEQLNAYVGNYFRVHDNGLDASITCTVYPAKLVALLRPPLPARPAQRRRRRTRRLSEG